MATDTAGSPTSGLASGAARAVRGQLLIDGRLVAGAVVFAGATIREVITGDAIARERLPAQVFEASLVSPGLIDLQINGGFGHDVAEGGAALRALAQALPATGVTSFLPTLVSGPPASYAAAYQAFDEARGVPGALPLGLHFEGPFISPARAGAHARAAIAAADPSLFDDPRGHGTLRLVTLAPERAGALALIGRLHAAGVVVSMGHTDASFDELTAGIDAGATMITHLYNAMSPLGHRAPGAVGAALADARVVAGVIADGVHVHPAALRLARATKGPSGLVLVTDAVAAAGQAPGRYQLGGAAVVSDGAAVRLASDGTTLAGSALTLDQAVRNFARFTGAPVAEALHIATFVPARLLGPAAINKGRLAVGADADLVLWSSELEVERTFIAGAQVFERPAATT